MICPVCKKETLCTGWKKKSVWIDSKEYPTYILMEWCNSCGYEKPNTCNIELLTEDNPKDIPSITKKERDRLNNENKKMAPANQTTKKYDIITFLKTKGASGIATDEYVSELRENGNLKTVSKRRYKLLVGAKRDNAYKQSQRIPMCKTILDNHFIDTEKSTLILSTSHEINPKTGDMIRHFYFVSDEGLFYRIILRPNGKQDSPRRMSIPEMKKVLEKEDPDLYIQYFPLTKNTTNREEDDSLNKYSKPNYRPRSYEDSPREERKVNQDVPTPQNEAPDTNKPDEVPVAADTVSRKDPSPSDSKDNDDLETQYATEAPNYDIRNDFDDADISAITQNIETNNKEKPQGALMKHLPLPPQGFIQPTNI